LNLIGYGKNSYSSKPFQRFIKFIQKKWLKPLQKNHSQRFKPLAIGKKHIHQNRFNGL